MLTADTEPQGRLFLVRHGSTEWSRSGQHTGRTDLPLLPEGEADAARVGQALAGRRFATVLASPLQRAWRTAEIAGVTPEAEQNLMEWDYGGYEGLTSAQIREERPGWTVFADGVVPGETPGETLAEVAARAGSVLDRIATDLGHGDVLLVGHGHTLRVLACVFLGLAPEHGASLLLDAGSISVLEHERERPSIRLWNWRAGTELPLAD